MDSARNLPLGAGVRVLDETGGLIFLSKPEGVRAHPNQTGEVDPGALLAAPFDLEKEQYLLKGGAFHLLHRLDAPTSGVMVGATDAGIAEAVRALFEGRAVEKVYFAWLKGRVNRPATWQDRLAVKRTREGVRVETGSGDLAETEVRPLRPATWQGQEMTLVEMQPRTGRTHQLRVQAASRRLPIIGDATYGDFGFNRRFGRETGRRRLFLHAGRLAFALSGREFVAEDPLPESFGASAEKASG